MGKYTPIGGVFTPKNVGRKNEMGVRAGIFFTNDIAIRPAPPTTPPTIVKLWLVRFTCPRVSKMSLPRGM